MKYLYLKTRTKLQDRNYDDVQICSDGSEMYVYIFEATKFEKQFYGGKND